MSEQQFAQWWLASKYCQVGNGHGVQIARDAWNAAEAAARAARPEPTAAVASLQSSAVEKPA